MTMEEFNEGFGMLLDYYPNTRVTEGLVNIYFMGLAELSIEQFNYAIGRIVKEYEGDFMPKVPVILKYAKDSDLEQQVFYAKKLLKTAIHKNGSKGMVCFEDKGVHAVVDYAGWNRLCTMKDDEFDSFLKWEFDGIYKGFCEHPYETSDYCRGSSQLLGQTKPRMISYKEAKIGNTENMNFIRLEYKNITAQIENKVDLSEIKNRMLIGG